LLAVLDRAIEQGAKAQRDRHSGQGGLFGGFDVGAPTSDQHTLPSIPPWSRKEVLAHEKDALGFYVSGHPLEDYAAAIRGLTKFDTGNIGEASHGEQAALGGLVIDLALKTTRKGDRFALFRLEDQFGSVKIVCWPDAYARYREVIKDDQVLLVTGRLELSDEGAPTLIAQVIQPLESARAKATRTVIIRADERVLTRDKLALLEELLYDHPGTTRLVIDLSTADGLELRIEPHPAWRVSVTTELVERMEALDRDWEVELSIND
jgi:DNA polymerase-3 subunit alpha